MSSWNWPWKKTMLTQIFETLSLFLVHCLVLNQRAPVKSSLKNAYFGCITLFNVVNFFQHLIYCKISEQAINIKYLLSQPLSLSIPFQCNLLSAQRKCAWNLQLSAFEFPTKSLQNQHNKVFKLDIPVPHVIWMNRHVQVDTVWRLLAQCQLELCQIFL